jgi:AcrR family transcriptional regulator
MALMTRRQRVRESTTDGILDVACGLLSRGGPGAVTLRAIAREMGMVPAGLYRYFPSHDELLAALRVRLFKEACAAVDAAPTSPAASGRALRRWALAHPHEFAVMYGKRCAAAEAAPAAEAALAAVFGAWMPAQVAARCWARLCGLVLLEVLGHLADADAVFEAELAAMTPLRPGAAT